MATEVTPVHSPAHVERYMKKVFEEKDLAAVPISFDMKVLEKYREAGAMLIRTRSAGRVERPDWRLDFGIVDDEGVIHAAAGDVMSLPKAEREHFARYAAGRYVNARFLKMRLGMGACVDEGDIETWDGRPSG